MISEVYHVSKIENVKELGISSGLSLAGGIIILVGATVSWIWHVSFFPQMGWMMGGPPFAAMTAGVSIVGIVSGAMVVLGGIMMYAKPHETPKWGVLVLIFSVISLFGMGGFLIGAVLGIIGGVLAVTRR